MGAIISKVKNVLYYLPKKPMTKLRYKYSTGKKLDFNNPKDFNEKVLTLLATKFGQLETDCADKYKVRQFVEKRGLGNILTKLYGKYDNANDIKFDELPEEYVLKTNHGCGCTIIKEKGKNIDIQDAIKSLNDSLSKNYAKLSFEYQYAKIKPCILCEEYLKEEGKKNPTDYKFYCFDGKVDSVLICSEREKKLRLDYFDLNWNYLDYAKEEYRSNKKLEKPKELSQMVEIASILSKGFPFVRVDLYDINGKIYFGELTFTPAGGIVKYNTDEALEYFGNSIDIK